MLIATGRVARRAAVLATVAGGAVPAVVAVARGSSDVTMPFVALGLATGAALGWAADDPAREVLAATPLAPWRYPARIAWAAAVAGVVGLVVVAGSAPFADAAIGPRFAESAAAAAVALATSAAVARRSPDAGVAGVTVGVLLPVVVAGLAVRWSALPNFTAGPTHSRWWWLAAAGVVVTFGVGPEPFRRRTRQEGHDQNSHDPDRRAPRADRAGRGRQRVR